MRFAGSILVACALGASLLGQAPAAVPASAGKVGVINIQQAILATAEGKQAEAAINKRFAPKKQQLQEQNQQIQALQQKLQNGGNTLSNDAKEQLAQQIQSQQKDLRRAIEDAQSDFQTAQSEMANRIGTKMMKVVSSYASSHGFSLILDIGSQASPVLFYTPTVDVTNAVVALYNQQHPVSAASSGTAQ